MSTCRFCSVTQVINLLCNKKITCNACNKNAIDIEMDITQSGMLINHVPTMKNVVAQRWNEVEFLFDLEVKRTLKIRLCGEVVSTLKSMLKLTFSNIEIRRCFNACWILTLFIIFKFLYCKYEYISLYQFDRLFCILFSAYTRSQQFLSYTIGHIW